MTVSLDRPPLEGALGIPGASAVSLLDPEGPTVLWWAGVGPPSERLSALVVDLVLAAAGLVDACEPGDDLGDVLLTSTEAFHVVRRATDGPSLVAHLTLRRSGANLAMARHEFKALVDAYSREPAEAKHAAGARTAVLPRRDRGDPAVRTTPGWLNLLGRPYSTDNRTLDRIVAALRRL